VPAPDRHATIGPVEEEGIMRPRLLGSFVVVLLAAVTAFGFGADADAQKPPTQGHPLVGTWLADSDLETPDNPLDTFVFSSDGIYVQSEAGGGSMLGAWEATGDRTAILTAVSAEMDEEGTNVGSIRIRASIEVSDNDNRFTAGYTIEFIQANGTSGGEAGPGTVTGERLVVEGPGTPTMTLDELFDQFQGGIDEGGAEATPAP
jgi:hypothetical protein